MKIEEFMKVWFDENESDDTKIIFFNVSEEQTSGACTARVLKTQIGEPRSKELANAEIMQWCIDYKNKTIHIYY